MQRPDRACPDCDAPVESLSRRDFLAAGSAAALALGASPLLAEDKVKATAKATAKVGVSTKATVAAPESLVKVLYDSFTEAQQKDVCFDWDYVESKTRPGLNGRNAPARGLLRTYVANNWQITNHSLLGLNQNFYTAEQRDIVRKIFEGLIQPEWQKQIERDIIDPAILLRVLDSIVFALDHQQVQLDAKADKVPYTSSR